MKLDFTDTEPPEEKFFKTSLPEHELRFVSDAREVSANAEILSVFVQSQIDTAFLDSHPSIRLITTRSSGHHHVAVGQAAGSNANTVAQHTFALMLALSRRLTEATEARRSTIFL